MESGNSRSAPAGLPYLNNLRRVLFTALINAACILVFNWKLEITWLSVVVAAVVCGVLTSAINILFISRIVEKMRGAGTLPARVPLSPFMSRLPRNKFLLIALFAVAFGALAALANWLLIGFYQIKTFSLTRFAVWQAAYSCPLSIMISELAVLRFVQPDCARPDQPPQNGDAQVRNPLTKLSSFKAWFNTVTDDFGFNMAIGLLLGGTVIDAGQNVIITPTTRAGIVISSLILGLIVTLRMAYPIAKSLYDARKAGSLPPVEKKNPWLSCLPGKPWKLTAALALPIMLLSLLVFWAVLTFFDFDVLNFFQFFVIRTVYVSFLTKGVVKLAVARFRQPDIR